MVALRVRTGQRSGGDHGTADKAFRLKKRGFITSDRQTGLSVLQRFVAVWLLTVFGALAYATVASAETRTLKLYYVHTREKAEITYKKNGRYLKGGLNEINRFLRDWRRNEPTKMDPRLLDLVWEAYRKSGARKHIHVISAYRSPATNAMLRKRGRGVARKSQHTLGRAMDFYIPDVKLSKLRRIGLQMQVGGVGYYPRSGSPFVHFDVGSVRHWPRMSRRELAAVFPNGKTLHVPTDGKPLPGYNQALASYKKRQKTGAPVIVANAKPAKPEKKQKEGGGFLSAFFSGGQDDEEDRVQAATEPKRVKTIPAPAPAEQQPQTPEMIIAALPARDVPLPLAAPRPKIEVGYAAEPVAETLAGQIPPEPSEPVVTAALDIPFPTPRPSKALDTAITQRIAAGTDVETTTGTVIAAAGKDGIEDALAIMSNSDAEDGKGGRIVAVPLPEFRPARQGEPVVVAALPDDGPVLDVGNSRFAVPVLRDTGDSAKADRVGSITSAANDRKTAASPREFILASTEPIDPLEAVATDIRTTEKSGKPVAADQRPERQVMIVPLPENLSRRAFTKTHIARVRGHSIAPSFEFDLVGRAPREIYTAGFSRTAKIDNPYRFTGKAVQFLSVAKFN